MYPHSCVTVGNLHRSFWKDLHCVCKMSQRMFALLIIMPGCLRRCIPLFHNALLKLVWGLRILDGNVHSYNQCVRLGIETGTHCLRKSRVKTAHRLIVTALSLLEGCMPVSLLPTNPLTQTLNPTLMHNPNPKPCYPHAGQLSHSGYASDASLCRPNA